MTEPIVSKTRVCIKNLPPKTTEQDLKEFILKEQRQGGKNDDDGMKKLEITDCKILKNAKGKSRKVAFVGFRQPEQAARVVEKFHRTYLNMSRITVEAATAKKDDNEKGKDVDAKKKSKSKQQDDNKTKQNQSVDGKTKDEKKVADSKVEEF